MWTAGLRRRRAQLEESLSRAGRLHTLSLARQRLHLALCDALGRNARGRCLDAGSGRSPYRAILEEAGTALVSIDLEDRSGDVDVLADVQAMPQIESDSFDTVLCTQVLEHVPRPWDAMGELRRVLAPGGILVLSVPHLSVIHEAPHDFYRYTRFGIEALCEQAGLEIVELVPTGGILTFLGHGASGLIMSTLGTVPLLRWPTWMLNYLLLVVALGWLDRLVGLPGLYPCDHVAVVQKTAC